MAIMAIIPTRKDNLVIENIRPSIEGGRFMLKREPGDTVTLTADIFRHSHEKYDAAIFYRHDSKKKWEMAPMHFVDNDQWEGSFTVNTLSYGSSHPVVLGCGHGFPSGLADSAA